MLCTDHYLQPPTSSTRSTAPFAPSSLPFSAPPSSSTSCGHEQPLAGWDERVLVEVIVCL